MAKTLNVIGSSAKEKEEEEEKLRQSNAEDVFIFARFFFLRHLLLVFPERISQFYDHRLNRKRERREIFVEHVF